MKRNLVFEDYEKVKNKKPEERYLGAMPEEADSLTR